jgi:hypothetical protein
MASETGGSRFRVLGSLFVFRFGSGFRVQGSGFRVRANTEPNSEPGTEQRTQNRTTNPEPNLNLNTN